MKKTFAKIAALSMAACLTLGLAACGIITQNGGEGGKLPEKNFEKAWAAAFDAKNFENFKFTATQKIVQQGEVVNDTRITLVHAGKLDHVKIYEKTDEYTSEYYYDGELYYEKYEDEWEIDSDLDELNSTVFLRDLCRFADKANEVEYSEEKGGYVLQYVEHLSEEYSVPLTTIFTFKDGKLEKMIGNSTLEDGTRIDNAYSFTYGGQTVTLPKIEEEDDDPSKDDPSQNDYNAGTIEDPYRLTLWGSAEQLQSLSEMVETFLAQKEQEGEYFDITIYSCDAGAAYYRLSPDPASGADVFAFINDDIMKLNSIGALSPLAPTEVSSLVNRMPTVALELGYFNGNFYGYPYSADNGFFMYYDKSVVKANHIDNLQEILADLKAAGKKFLFEGETAWYTLSFAYGAGGRYEVVYDGFNAKEVKTNLAEKAPGSEYSYGQLGGQMVADLVKSSAYQAGGNDAISAALTSGTFGVAISGTWEADTIKAGLGENYGATILPDWTSSLDGKTYPWYSFAGGKLYGVNGFSKNPLAAHELASFLVEDSQQEKRFADNSVLPTSKNVINSTAVQSNVAAAALLKQMNHAIIQRPMPQSYWDEVGAFATWLGTFRGNADELQTRVEEMVEAMKNNTTLLYQGL